MKHKDTVALLLRDIPRAVRDQFKAYCSRRGLSMTRLVQEFMRSKCDEDRRALEPLKR